MSDFLENLKKAVDVGEFNSEAAKKINAINELAEQKLKNALSTGKSVSDAVDERLKNAGIKEVNEDEVATINSEYEKKMADIKLKDAVIKQLGTLIEIEEMVQLSVDDMKSHINELEDKFSKEIDENPIYAELSIKISEIKSKYNNLFRC